MWLPTVLSVALARDGNARMSSIYTFRPSACRGILYSAASCKRTLECILRCFASHHPLSKRRSWRRNKAQYVVRSTSKKRRLHVFLLRILVMRPLIQAVRRKSELLQRTLSVYSKLANAGGQYSPCCIWNSTATRFLLRIAFNKVVVLSWWF